MRLTRPNPRSPIPRSVSERAERPSASGAAALPQARRPAAPGGANARPRARAARASCSVFTEGRSFICARRRFTRTSRPSFAARGRMRSAVFSHEGGRMKGTEPPPPSLWSISPLRRHPRAAAQPRRAWCTSPSDRGRRPGTTRGGERPRRRYSQRATRRVRCPRARLGLTDGDARTEPGRAARELIWPGTFADEPTPGRLVGPGRKATCPSGTSKKTRRRRTRRSRRRLRRPHRRRQATRNP